MLFYIITNINVIGIRSWRLCIFFGYILYLRVEKEVEESYKRLKKNNAAACFVFMPLAVPILILLLCHQN